DTRALQSSLLYSKVELGDVIIGMPMLIAFTVSILITLALYWQLRFTELGRMIRAAASDRGAAELMGINVNRVNTLAFRHRHRLSRHRSSAHDAGLLCRSGHRHVFHPDYVRGGCPGRIGQFRRCHAREFSGGSCAVYWGSFYAWIDRARTSLCVVRLGSAVQA